MEKFRLQGEIIIWTEMARVQLAVFDKTFEAKDDEKARERTLKLVQKEIDKLLFPKGIKKRIIFNTTKVICSDDCKFDENGNLSDSVDFESHPNFFQFHYQN